MHKLVWKPEYSIGIDVIDAQHRSILEQLLALENAVEKNDPWHILQYFTAEIESSLKFHFAVEEALLEILGFPQIEKHRAQHAKLASTMVEMEIQLKNSPATGDLLKFLEQWFIRHVLSDDRQYVSYVRDRLGAS